MYGPGTAPPQPRPAGRGSAMGLRVLFAVLPVVTLGLGAWGSVLRLALVLRRPLDRVLAPVVGVVGIGAFVLIGTAPSDSSWQSNVGAVCLLMCMFATPTYFLIVDIRGVRIPQLPRTAAPTHPPLHAPAQIPGAAPGPVAGHPGAPRTAPYGYGPPPTAAPVPPAGPRIHQVRAELDELSDLLRKEEGR